VFLQPWITLGDKSRFTLRNPSNEVLLFFPLSSNVFVSRTPLANPATVGLAGPTQDVNRISPMPANRFATLNGSTVAVELIHDGQRKLLCGVAAYCKDPLLGRILKIKVQEEWGDFDFVLRENEWDGEITRGTASGCDYEICIATNCVCAR